ncbi:MAG: DUF3999 family protein [Caldimonas sp.]
MACALLLAGASLACGHAGAEPAPFRSSAPIAIELAAPFVQMALPPAVYGQVEQDGLRDLRVVDARGERAPFALVEPAAALHTSEQVREATLYPLPLRPDSAGTWPSPVDVVVEGDRISVHRRAADAAAPPRESGGWLIDTGAAQPGEPRPSRLTLRWSGPAEFSAAYRLETSDDLRAWRGAPGGQVMALQSVRGALTQPVVPLPDAAGRFVRLMWSEPAAAPALDGATVLVLERRLLAVDAAHELTFAAVPEPAGTGAVDAAARRALYFDLGGALPLVDVNLAFASGTHVAPVRLQGRVRAGEPWRDLGGGVFYRLERGGEVARSPAIALPVTVRFLRVVPDERAAAFDGSSVQLVVHAALASLVFAAQGEPPFRLLAGSRDAPAGALPESTLVPQLDAERARFGRATLGAFVADENVVRAGEASARQARLRPWLLWGVLLVGVGGLATLVWRLARAPKS